MTQASLLKPTRKTDAKYLRDQVLLAEQHEANAAGSAATATNKATEASEDQALTEAAKNQTVALKDATENLKNQAAAIVVSGDVSYDPQANQVPLARANGAIDPQWIKGALKPVNWIEAGAATAGVLIPDDTETVFTAQMARFFPPYFIPETMTEELVIYDDAPLAICITTDKKIRVNHYGVYESEPLNVNNDWVTFGFGKADNQSDTVTIWFIANGQQLGSIQVGDYSDLAVRAIFNEGAIAGFYGCASPAHQKQNSTATERIHNPGDPVGYDYDLSPNGVDAPQPTSTARPLIGRQPLVGVRQLLQNSKKMSGPGWTSVEGVSEEGLTVTLDEKTGVLRMIADEGYTGYRFLDEQDSLYYTAGLGNHALSGAIAVDVRVNSGYAHVGCLNNGGGRSAGLSVDSAGEDTVISRAPNTSLSSSAVTDKENGWRRVEFVLTSGTSDNVFLRLGLGGNSAAGTAALTGPFDVEFRLPQMELGDEVTAFQETGDDPLLDCTEPGVQDVWFHQYGLDDVLPRTLPAITDGTIIIGGTKGIWVDTLTFAGGTFDFQDNNIYPGGNWGLYDLIGDLVGWFVADATLTSPQETAVVNWLIQKGCPGVFRVSEVELEENPGDPFVDTTGYGAGNSAALSVVDGDLRVGGSNGYAYASTGDITGLSTDAYYLVDVDVGTGDTNAKVTVGNTTGNSNLYDTGTIYSLTARNVRAIVSPSIAKLAINVFAWTASGVGLHRDYSKISLREITLDTGA